MRAKAYMDKFINPPEFMEEQQRKLEQERDKPEEATRPSPSATCCCSCSRTRRSRRWERDVLEIVRDEAYYFAPQRQTKIMNEGWASYWHCKIMTQRALKASEIIDYADHNAGVLATAPGQFNPYKLGVELFRHIEERWDKGRFGKEWNECQNLDDAPDLGQAARPRAEEDLRGAQALQRRHLHRRVLHRGVLPREQVLLVRLQRAHRQLRDRVARVHRR